MVGKPLVLMQESAAASDSRTKSCCCKLVCFFSLVGNCLPSHVTQILSDAGPFVIVLYNSLYLDIALVSVDEFWLFNIIELC